METFEFDDIVKLAISAGIEIMKIHDSSEGIIYSKKDDDSPLTKADEAAHEVIALELKNLTPSIPLVSEEGFHGDPMNSEYCWLVDPLDGTKEFIKRNGMFTVNIAFMQRHGKRWKPVWGVVHAPATGKIWTGGVDNPAIKLDGEISKLISVQKEIPEVVKLVASGSHRGEKDEFFAKSLGSHELVRMGSSLKVCSVADGSANLYPRFGPTSCWDIAAAHAVVAAAGGSIIGPDGKELDYDLVENVLNPFFMVTSTSHWNQAWLRCQD
jgi:3'(2'), 5'-bisphosphate nucleotidase